MSRLIALVHWLPADCATVRSMAVAAEKAEDIEIHDIKGVNMRNALASLR